MKRLLTVLLLSGMISCTNDFKKGEAQFENANYNEAKLHYLKVDASNRDFRKAEQRLIEIDSIQTKMKFDFATKVYEEGNYTEARALFLQIETGDDQQKKIKEILAKIDSIENARKREWEMEHEKEINKAKDVVRKLFNELLAFKDKSDFQRYGFGTGSKYNRWLTDVQKLKNTPTEKILIGLGFVPGDLEMLGLEYVSSKGKETEYSLYTKKTINDGLKK